jgi:hypothetical protein
MASNKMTAELFKAIDDASLLGIYKQSRRRVIVKTKVTKNGPKCVPKGIPILVSGVKERKTSLFHCSGHKLGSSNFN